MLLPSTSTMTSLTSIGACCSSTDKRASHAACPGYISVTSIPVLPPSNSSFTILIPMPHSSSPVVVCCKPPWRIRHTTSSSSSSVWHLSQTGAPLSPCSIEAAEESMLEGVEADEGEKGEERKEKLREGDCMELLGRDGGFWSSCPSDVSCPPPSPLLLTLRHVHDWHAPLVQAEQVHEQGAEQQPCSSALHDKHAEHGAGSLLRNSSTLTPSISFTLSPTASLLLRAAAPPHLMSWMYILPPAIPSLHPMTSSRCAMATWMNSRQCRVQIPPSSRACALVFPLGIKPIFLPASCQSLADQQRCRLPR
mmetsp:Transcript_14140/g.48597  ORF Transcript_14140/g.48597 Transcript_14140/m.48597 type:complete len:308 (-) Transcript_14140:188-1111(-)